jgi:hypothetical protein
MDPELRDAFASLNSTLSDVAKDARDASARTRETSAAVEKLAARVEHIEGAVFGSGPPPAPGKPLAARVSNGEGNVAELTGRLMALQAVVADVQRQNAEQLVVLGRISTSVSSVLTHPLVRKIGLVLGTLVLLWLSAAQAKLQGVLP